MDLQTTTIAFICPTCGASLVKDINIFSLSGGLDISCRCGETLSIKMSHDRKVTLSVPCPACPDNHTTRLSGTSFFQKELFKVQCPYTALDICFIGQKSNVMKALDEHKKFLEEALAESQVNEMPEDDATDDAYAHYDNPAVMREVLLILRDFLADNDVVCDCTPEERMVSIDIARDYIVLRCDNCGKSRKLRALTENDVTYLCELNKLELK